ncbi:MAG: hypothetical protein GTO24_15615 [candidate division Zixibacteria bacterium]|nr:hypothetical protein [candidate division Zixibacteria bacterium]
MIDTGIRVILSIDPSGGCGVFVKGDSAAGRRVAEELYDFLKEEVVVLFQKASMFQGRNDELAS